MLGFAVLLLFDFVGLLLQRLAHIPLPGNVIGLLLFTLALFRGWIKLQWVEASAQFLLSHMLVFFAPVIVGVLAVYPLLKGQVLPAAAGLIVSTIVGLVVAGLVTKKLQPSEEKEGQ